MSLTLSITSDFGVFKVKIGGNLDSDTSTQFDDRMVDMLQGADLRAVQLHLQDLKYISSMGLGVISKLRKAVTAKGGAFLIVGAQPQVARVFEVVKMLPKETVFASHEEADTYLAALQKKIIDEQGQK